MINFKFEVNERANIVPELELAPNQEDQFTKAKTYVLGIFYLVALVGMFLGFLLIKGIGCLLLIPICINSFSIILKRVSYKNYYKLSVSLDKLIIKLFIKKENEKSS